MKKKYIYTIIVVTFIILGGITTMLLNTGIQKRNLQQYVEKELEVKFKEGIFEEEGSIKKSLFDEVAYIRLSIEREKKDEIINTLNAKYREYEEIETFKVPGYQGNVYQKELLESRIDDLYFIMKKGKRNKTRSVEVYIAENVNGNIYLYFMG
ncbi:peptidoglycan binding domain-containing protein [Blautia sp. MSJ-36]|uniref:peptidoglycan binding domain-containing protein n=1 Tax=Blautia sp. MSJ-36 TaxID=2841530 RepID=UPI001C11E806|nr:peptidoglycan binding domain-containing protein [Blautia sp. MSJ-36]MBU5447881.1 peptidoglycan binding domain-containing protein [Blautia sp. MSJ-36]